jgi:hypothetical protein
MKNRTRMLVGAVALLATTLVNAQEPAFRATGLTCDKVTWSRQSLAVYPQIGDACQEVMQRDGKYYVRFDGKVRRVTDNGQQVTIDFRDGDLLTLTPPENLNLTINDKQTSPRDLLPGDQLKFYIPQDQLTAIFFAGQPATASAQMVPIARPTTLAAAPAPAPARVAAAPARRVLPGTASRLPLLALAGMILMLLGAALTFRRKTRIAV